LPTDFESEQLRVTVGDPPVNVKAYYLLALEGTREHLQRANISVASGTPCPETRPTLPPNETLTNSSADRQRIALLTYFQNVRGQNEGQSVEHKINNNALFAKVDCNLTCANNLSASYNFDFSKNRNQTFDVPTYGSSANGTEGPSKINILNVNLFS